MILTPISGEKFLFKTGIMNKISLIVAADLKNGIGKDNKLLCHIPSDLKRFRKITSGHTVIMGRNTFLSLPGGALKNRRNIVITDVPEDDFRDCKIVNSVEEAMKHCDPDRENFVIGGASVYRQFLPYASRLYLTRILHTFDADTFFPVISQDEWREVRRDDPEKDETNDFFHVFTILERKS